SPLPYERQFSAETSTSASTGGAGMYVGVAPLPNGGFRAWFGDGDLLDLEMCPTNGDASPSTVATGVPLTAQPSVLDFGYQSLLGLQIHGRVTGTSNEVAQSPTIDHPSSTRPTGRTYREVVGISSGRGPSRFSPYPARSSPRRIVGQRGTGSARGDSSRTPSTSFTAAQVFVPSSFDAIEREHGSATSQNHPIVVGSGEGRSSPPDQARFAPGRIFSPRGTESAGREEFFAPEDLLGGGYAGESPRPAMFAPARIFGPNDVDTTGQTTDRTFSDQVNNTIESRTSVGTVNFAPGRIFGPSAVDPRRRDHRDLLGLQSGAMPLGSSVPLTREPISWDGDVDGMDLDDSDGEHHELGFGLNTVGSGVREYHAPMGYHASLPPGSSFSSRRGSPSTAMSPDGEVDGRALDGSDEDMPECDGSKMEYLEDD
ncbi:hypothetical protein FRB90_005802, partial [Tulasnella sp. 427]